MNPIRILVIEDNEDDQTLFRRQLRTTVFDQGVMFVRDPRVALDLMQGPTGSSFREGLVAMFIDVNLPFMSGIELLRVIRAEESTNHVPVAVMSTTPRPETLEACRDLKTIAFLEKPVTLPKFLNVVATLFHDPILRSGGVS